MSLSDSKARMNSAHRDLMNAWYKVSEAWRDDTARGAAQPPRTRMETYLRSQ